MSTKNTACDRDHPSDRTLSLSSSPRNGEVNNSIISGNKAYLSPSPSPSPPSRKRPREISPRHQSTIEANTTPSQDATMSEGNTNGDNFVVRGLRLEAIFHPKFDNERKNSNLKNNKANTSKGGGMSSNIRSAMLEKLGETETRSASPLNDTSTASSPKTKPTAAAGRGHLEVSLKHSGSLVLWSGSTRYYSKNSACNEFTRTAEVLLRQRFETVRGALANHNSGDTNTTPARPFRSYEECSFFVSQNRYTVAFEVCTAEMLGDHGQIPNLDYVVVTAVADRGRERFLSTTEVLEFCHDFRLPHNDVWTFFPGDSKSHSSSTGSATRLFDLYDKSLRETGDTEQTVRKLTEIADVYVPSPVPHSIYQGSVCEGFIVRYVDSHHEAEREKVERLARVSSEILGEVPPSRASSPPASKSADKISNTSIDSDPVLTTDLRALYRSISVPSNDGTSDDASNSGGNKAQEKDGKFASAIAPGRKRAALFSERLGELLSGTCCSVGSEGDAVREKDDCQQAKRRKRIHHRFDLKKLEAQNDDCGGFTDWKNHHLPALAKDLIHSKDRETRRIAALLQTLDDLKGGAINYTWMEKYEEKQKGNEPGCDHTQTMDRDLRRRLYCTIHVRNDSTFFKFQNVQRPSDMTLFRGFCVEVLLSPPEEIQSDTDKDASADMTIEPAPVSTGPPLMLKMKLLPYMVRTFVCRNLLGTIEKKGAEEFERVARGLLEKWKISPEAQERWMAFFCGWAAYVLKVKNSQDQRAREGDSNGLTKDTGTKSQPNAIDEKSFELGPLTNFSYLRHLEYYTKLYDAGTFKAMASASPLSSPESYVFVCVVSQSTEVSRALADHLARHFSETEATDQESNSGTGTMPIFALGEAAKNRRCKSCIAYANVCDQTKGIKKFLFDKKMAKNLVLILLGSGKEDILAMARSPTDARPSSWLDIETTGEGKKLTHMWKTWKKYPCAERIALASSVVVLEPKKEDSTVAVLTELAGASEVVKSVRAVGRSVMEQAAKQQSDPRLGGILVLFPGIPGCGKSSLLATLETRLEQELSSRKSENGDAYDRSVRIREGDKMGKKFWDAIEDLLSDDDGDHPSPPLVLADKNTPPASWPKLGQICSDSNGVLLPVLPDKTVLETTTIKGSIQPSGDLLPSASHFYPFSLDYLAVSMSRVLDRPPGEHAGKLDSGFPMACMIVAQFYSFYRYVAADAFMEKLEEKLGNDSESKIKTMNPIELPFFKGPDESKVIPDDLKKLLVEALQLRHGHDKAKKFKVKKDDPQMIDLEGRLRSSFEMHKETLSAMSVGLDVAKEAFVHQLIDRIKSNSDTQTTGGPADDTDAKHTVANDQGSDNATESSIKLVSLDIDRAKIHELLYKHEESGALAGFFEQTKRPQTDAQEAASASYIKQDGLDNNNSIKSRSSSERYPSPCFTEKTHVTMSFAGESHSGEQLVERFHHLQGTEVSVSITGFLWSLENAAFSVKVSPVSDGSPSLPVPPCANAFPHLTVWCAPDVKASLSNNLPALVESGAAHRIDFSGEAEVLVGRISFWNHANEPIRV